MDALARLAANPPAAALLLDVDGVLAPIVDDPGRARVPDTVRAELRRLAGDYGLVACVTGRPSADARRIVGVPELRYVGEHGLELEPDAARFAEEIHRLADESSWPDVEQKPYSAALHYRTAPDPGEARRRLETVAETARERGLTARFGRMVLELLPPVVATKGTAVRHLLAESGLARALYAGDDTTDLDAFAALDGLELAVRVAVASPESPPELRARADVVVGSPAELALLLERL
ncbi:MAG TPA: trehalose-phosphatase [Gaiellaceae bacterium]|nr:trehalose-phosphatase [Gaiellaceae bacterium]